MRLVDVIAPDLDVVLADTEATTGVTAFDVRHRAGDEAQVQFGTDEPVLLLTMLHSGTPFESPVTIADGDARMEVRA